MNDTMNSTIEPVMLSPEDRAAVDALIDAGFDLSAVAEHHRPRAERAARLLGLMEHLPEAPSSELLTQQTLLAVAEVRRQQRTAGQVPGGNDANAPTFRLPDMFGLAAAMLIGLSLLWPMLGGVQQSARQIACQANLANASMGFASYAAANHDAMPATKTREGNPWWLTNQFDEDGATRSNSAHLFVLVRSGHVNLRTLSCPENEHAATEVQPQMRDWPTAESRSFSYQNQQGEGERRWSRGPGIAVLADRNPLFTNGTYHKELPDDAISPNHAVLGGQNVLMSDGRVLWLRMPLLPHKPDNIWHAEGLIEHYRGTETPLDDKDSFLVP